MPHSAPMSTAAERALHATAGRLNFVIEPPRGACRAYIRECTRLTALPVTSAPGHPEWEASWCQVGILSMSSVTSSSSGCFQMTYSVTMTIRAATTTEPRTQLPQKRDLERVL